MNILLLLLMLIGPINTFLVGTYFIIKKSVKFEYKLIAAVIVLLSLEIFREFLFVFGTKIGLRSPIESFFHFSLLLPALLLIASKRNNNKHYKVKFLLFIPWLIEFLIVGLILLEIIPVRGLVNFYLPILISIIGFIWMIIVYKKLSHHKSINIIITVIYKLVLCVYITSFITSIFFILFYLKFIHIEDSYYFVVKLKPILSSIILFILSYYFISNDKKLLKKRKKVSVQSNINQEIIEHIIINEDFLDSELTIEKLAVKYNVDSRTLSDSIYNFEKMSFNNFINSLRLKKFIALLEKGEHRKKTLLAVSEESGFKSKATFNRVFKKEFDVTPSKYIEKNNLD